MYMSVDLENRLNKQWSICLQKADKANNQACAYFYIIIHCWSVSVCGLTPDKQQTDRNVVTSWCCWHRCLHCSRAGAQAGWSRTGAAKEHREKKAAILLERKEGGRELSHVPGAQRHQRSPPRCRSPRVVVDAHGAMGLPAPCSAP